MWHLVDTIVPLCWPWYFLLTMAAISWLVLPQRQPFWDGSHYSFSKFKQYLLPKVVQGFRDWTLLGSNLTRTKLPPTDRYSIFYERSLHCSVYFKVLLLFFLEFYPFPSAERNYFGLDFFIHAAENIIKRAGVVSHWKGWHNKYVLLGCEWSSLRWKADCVSHKTFNIKSLFEPKCDIS